MDIEEIKKLMLEKMLNAAEQPIIPDALNDERLEDAFMEPEYNEDGYAASMPIIWNSSSYGQTSEGVKILSLRSARTASGLYSKYVDEYALIWDASKQELFLYVPDEKCRTVAFKGGSWLCAKKLKIQYWDLNIYEVYKELQAKIKDELNSNNDRYR